MAERAVILSVDKWSMPDERTGEIRDGLSVWYVNEYREDTKDALGSKPTKVSASPELFDLFTKARLPALFNLHFGSRPGAQGKATLTLTGVDGIANLNLFAPAKSKETAAAT